jgi:hypothetical protein
VESRSTIRPVTGLAGVLNEAIGVRFATSWGAAQAIAGKDIRTINMTHVFMRVLRAMG